MVHALHRAERETCGRVENSCCETVDSNLHLRHFSKTTFFGLIGVLRRYVKSWLQELGFIPVPRLSARFPIFFNVVSRVRNSFALESANTLLISPACLRQIGALTSLHCGVREPIRPRRSSVA